MSISGGRYLCYLLQVVVLPIIVIIINYYGFIAALELRKYASQF